MLDNLTGRVALVTGASRGIGQAIAIALAQAGANIAVNYRSRERDAEQVCSEIDKGGRRAVAVAADVSVATEVTRLVETVEAELGPVEILVNNAGVTRPQPIDEITEQDWDEILAVNLKSMFLVTQAVLPSMRAARWGRIINLSCAAMACLLLATVQVFAERPNEPASEPVVATPIADSYRSTAKQIIAATLAGNEAYAKLERLCDDTPHRLSGSPGLEQAIRWAASQMRSDGHENVRIEPVTVPHWVRGRESLRMVAPRRGELPMLGLGGSVGTAAEGITAEVIVVADEGQLEANGESAAGKIVLFNTALPPYDPAHGSGYGKAVRFRLRGASMAAKHGAVACLVRSVTANSLRSPHTGAMSYGDSAVKIPAAAVTVEDADMLARLQQRGIKIEVTLKMEAKTLEPAKSGNVVGELRGSKIPEEIVVIGGHIDGWDVGQGAHDDGAGCVMAMEALTILRRQRLIPRRTIRVVLWTNEENGFAGAKQYVLDHAGELAHHVAAIEADSGGFAPRGYYVQCRDKEREKRAAAQLRDITTLFTQFKANHVATGHSGPDVRRMGPAGVILMGHRCDFSTYFDYHHSRADTLDKVDPKMLSQNVAVLATTAFILADVPARFGHASNVILNPVKNLGKSG
jgi:hypothetical protein